MEEDSDSSDKLRVEIDTSPPFETVKEAVELFGGRQWIPLHLLRLTHETDDVFGIEKLKENLTMKEHQALNILRQLKAANTFVRELKLSHRFVLSPSPGLMLSELSKAKLSLTKTFADLSLIQASVESDEILLENDGNSVSSAKTTMLSAEGDFETEQFINTMTEASRYEVVKAMAEIERTKNSIRLAEMRLNAAKKMEEAAKALEAIAEAQRNNGFITLSSEDYETLVRKAEEPPICKNKFVDATNNDDSVLPVILDKLEEIIAGETTRSTEVNIFSREAHHHHHNKTDDAIVDDHCCRENRDDKYERSKPGNNRTKTSIGEVLGKRLSLQDDGRTITSKRQPQHVSLGQMLRERKRLIVRSNKKTLQ